MKQILNCSTSLYRDTFLAIGRLIFAQNFTLEQKNNVAESICYVMETLDYPYTLNKSTFVNLTMTSFPTAIGVLDWLIQFYKCVNTEPVELDEDSPLHVCIAHYGQYIQQNDEQEVLEQVEKTFAEKLDSFNDEEQLEKEEAEIDGELEDLIARKNLMTELEDNLASKIGKEKDTQKYVQHNKQSVEYIKKVHEKLSKSITQLNDERAQIKLNNQKLLAQIGDKENAEDLQKAYKKKELVLKSHQADRSSYQNQCNQCDVPITRLKSKIADQVHDYNQLVLDSRLDKSEEYLLEDNLVHDVLKGQSIIDIKSQIISEKCQERQKGIGSLLLEANELKHEIQKIENNSQAKGSKN